MTGDQLKQAQHALGFSNRQLCTRLGVAETTLCNWKAGRWPVPKMVALAVKYLIEHQVRA